MDTLSKEILYYEHSYHNTPTSKIKGNTWFKIETWKCKTRVYHCFESTRGLTCARLFALQRLRSSSWVRGSRTRTRRP